MHSIGAAYRYMLRRVHVVVVSEKSTRAFVLSPIFLQNLKQLEAFTELKGLYIITFG